MPSPHEIFVSLLICNSKPLLNLHFTTFLLLTLMNLDKILESILLINTSKSEQTADSRSVSMNRTSSIFQEQTGFFLSCHLYIRKYHPVNYIQFQIVCKQCIKILFLSELQSPQIHWIQYDGISHSLTACRAAFTVMTVHLNHISRGIQTSV